MCRYRSLPHRRPADQAAAPLLRDPSVLNHHQWVDPVPDWVIQDTAAQSESDVLEEQMLRAGILASLQDAPDDPNAKVEVPKSSVSSLRLVITLFINISFWGLFQSPHITSCDSFNICDLKVIIHVSSQTPAAGEDGIPHRESRRGTGSFQTARWRHLPAHRRQRRRTGGGGVERKDAAGHIDSLALPDSHCVCIRGVNWARVMLGFC